MQSAELGSHAPNASTQVVDSFLEGSLGAQFTLSWSILLLIVCMTFISIVTVVGNLVVILSFYIDKTIRQPSNYFIFSLAVSDLIIGLEGIPVYTYFLINSQKWPFGAFLCDLWLSLDYSCCLASIYTVLGITIDRYCSVKYPAAYRNWRTPPKVLVIIALTWIVGLYSWEEHSRGRILKPDECYVQFMTNAYLNMGMYIAYYWSTLFLMLYLYFGIYAAAKQLASHHDQKQRRLAVLSEMRQRATSSSKRDRHASTMMSDAAISNLDTIPTSSDSLVPTLRKATVDGRWDIWWIMECRRASGQFRCTSAGVRDRNYSTFETGRTASSAVMTLPARAIDSNGRLPKGQPEFSSSHSGSMQALTPAQNETHTKEDLGAIEDRVGLTIAKNPSYSLSGGTSSTSGVDTGRLELHLALMAAATEPPQSANEKSISEAMEPPDSGLGAFSIDDDEIPFVDDFMEGSSMNGDYLGFLIPSTPSPPPPTITEEREEVPVAMIIELPSGEGEGNKTRRSLTDRPSISNSEYLGNSAISSHLYGVGNHSADGLPKPMVEVVVQKNDLNSPLSRIRPTGKSEAPRPSVAAIGIDGVRRLLTVVRNHSSRRKSQIVQTIASRRPTLSQMTKKSSNGTREKRSKSSHSRSENRARKALRTITVILGAFTIFWTPFYVLATIYGFCERCMASAAFNSLYVISYYLCYMNSPLNPLAYAMANQQFKKTFKRILRGDLRRT